jgi:predicted MFS family arabinose efflux permease
MPSLSLAPYRALLRRPGTVRLVATSVLARMPSGMGALSLVLLVQSSTGSFGLAGLVAGAFTIGISAGGPLQGRLIDRLGQTRVLLACGTVFATAFTTLALVAGRGAGIGVLVGCALVGGLAHPPVSAAMRVLWTTVVDGPGLQTAYAFESTMQELVFITGPLLVALLVTVFSPTAAVLAAGLLTLAGTVAFATAPASRAWRGQARTRDWAGPLRSRGFRTLITVQPLVAATIGGIEVSVVAFATADGARGRAGVILALWSLGSLAGGLVAGARRWGSPIERRYLLLLSAVAVAVAALLLARSSLQLAGLIFLTGLPFAPWLACVYLLVDRLAPPGTLTEAFSWVLTSFMAGFSAGTSLAGGVVDAAGAHTALLAALGGTILALTVARLRLATLEPAPA